MQLKKVLGNHRKGHKGPGHKEKELGDLGQWSLIRGIGGKVKGGERKFHGIPSSHIFVVAFLVFLPSSCAERVCSFCLRCPLPSHAVAFYELSNSHTIVIPVRA
ncbi:hypothetical protein ACH5RR_040168 [Cinchona calisaya]|uniref:Uncharacterized protein n=1 Tax=Cinchona calisaya TaxID=153742 RepID=A0ABD2XRJ4_9GENT